MIVDARLGKRPLDAEAAPSEIMRRSRVRPRTPFPHGGSASPPYGGQVIRDNAPLSLVGRVSSSLPALSARYHLLSLTRGRPRTRAGTATSRRFESELSR